MIVFNLLKGLSKMKLLSPVGLYSIISGILRHGINCFLLLHVANQTAGKVQAIVCEQGTIRYKELFKEAEKLAHFLKAEYSLAEGQRVGFYCRNHLTFVKSLFAVSRIGPSIYLLNTEMSNEQVRASAKEFQFNLLIYDAEFEDVLKDITCVEAKVVSHHEHIPALNNFLHKHVNPLDRLPPTSTSTIVMLTGGTTGKPKKVVHKPSVINFIHPFLAMLNRLKFHHHNTIYIATPIYHGYGIAQLLASLALRKTIIISRRFTADNACAIIREHQVEAVTVVPLMLAKMIEHQVEDLASLSCIASGGAKLYPPLINQVTNELGDIVYNLYGTSESGLNVIATPNDLHYSPHTIGKAIEGMKIKVMDDNREVGAGEIGQLWIKNRWTMRNKKEKWIATGDLGYCDENGYYYLQGRVDDCIISAGEKVYPTDVEQVLQTYPNVKDVAVIGVADDRFGQRLVAFIELSSPHVTNEEIIAWLRSKVARFQLPKQILHLENMPYTPLGKLDKKELRSKYELMKSGDA